jgi:histidinol-phosphatase (PHP family)
MTTAVNPERFIADYHIHSPYCRHAQGKMIDYVHAAIANGLPEIAFSDHLGRYYLSSSQKKRYWDWGMSETALARYVMEVESLQEAFNDHITIRMGLEIDYVEGGEDLLKPILGGYPFDFLLASIHCLPAFSWKHLSTFVKKDTWPIFENYFHVVGAALQSGMFDSLAHVDFIWRYVKWPEGHSAEVFAYIQQMPALAEAAGMAMEINANAYLWSQLYQAGGGDPFAILVDSIHANRTHITVGSDAHKPEHVGKSLKEVVGVLKTKGVNSFSTFERRKEKIVFFP